MAKTFTTHHGTTVFVQTGETVLLEYRKGFLNEVRKYSSVEAAKQAKEMKQLHDSYNMQKNFHWSVQTIKE